MPDISRKSLKSGTMVKMNKILLVGINSKYIHSNPAIHSLYAYARDYRDYLEISEYTINQQENDILSDIYKRKPDVVAISCYIWNINMIELLLRDIPQVLPEAHIWLGGPEVSFDAPDRLKANPSIKGIMIGEGEVTFYELVRAYVESWQEDFAKIAGIYLQGNPPVYTGDRPVTDLDTIPFFYKDMGIEKFQNRIIYYESSRGCPFRCSYCLSSIEKYVRLRSLELILPELQFFLDNNVPQVKFIDRTFNCNKEHAMAIWQYILEHDNGVTNFHFEVAADIMTPEEIEIIRHIRPGLIQLEIGVQSTNGHTIEEINRTMDLKRVAENVAAVKAFENTHQHLDLIAGLPFEGYDSFVRSFNDVYAMRPDQLQLGFLKVLKGSYMESRIEVYGLRFHTKPPYEVFSTKWISYDEILKLKKIEEMVELFYNTGQFMASIRVLESGFNNYFDLYEALADYYERKNYFIQVPARNYRYNVVYEFGQEYMPEKLELLAQALTYDLYIRENCKSRVSFALDLSPYKEEIRELTRDKKNHIEVFYYPVWEKDIETMWQRSEKAIFVEFDYADREPMHNNACVKLLD